MFLRSALLLLAASGALAQVCNEVDHHPQNGGYFVVGVAGISTDEDLDSAHGQKLPNFTWSLGIEYPDGRLEICDSTRQRCDPACTQAPGCPKLMQSYTCSILRFCPPEGDTTAQEIYLMENLEKARACDFSSAEMLGSTNNGGNDGCFDYAFELDHEQTAYFFSSPDGCDAGQLIGIDIDDGEIHIDECRKIGLKTSRLRNCDCRFNIKNSTLGEPCRTAFSDQCEFLVQRGPCCDEGNCISKLEDWTNQIGREAELARRALCDDSVPGLCYNQDGAGSDVNGLGSTNCCTKTCTGCGIEDAPLAEWKPCTSVDAETGLANCGFLSRYDPNPFQCDFTKCDEDDYWHVDGNALKTYLGTSSADVGTLATGALAIAGAVFAFMV